MGTREEYVGSKVTVAVGKVDGASVGRDVGNPCLKVGFNVGSKEGMAVGIDDGSNVGLDAMNVGKSVGDVVGRHEGELDGRNVGKILLAFVGLFVGAT